ncbi:MAG TPA: energy transducer TonB [bacterium]|nr:energy transducer TonB [bacterium]
MKVILKRFIGPAAVLILAAAYAQNPVSEKPITLHAENQPLRSVLQKISNQSDASFIFADGLVDGKTISCRWSNVNLDSVLFEVANKSRLAYQMLPGPSVVLYPLPSTDSTAYRTLPTRSMIPPILQRKITPVYPPLAQNEGIEGSVLMNFLITEQGDVKDIQIVESSGYAILDRAAAAFAERLRFDPARQGDEPVDVRMSWGLNFHLLNREYLPLQYVSKINALTKYLEYTPEDRDLVLEQLLKIHIDFVDYYSEKPQLNFNQSIEKVIQPDIVEAWHLYWDKHPLHFLVFHDYISRYQRGSAVEKAEGHLYYYAKKQVRRILDMSQNNPARKEKDNVFISDITAYLQDKYSGKSWVDSIKEVSAEQYTRRN